MILELLPWDGKRDWESSEDERVWTPPLQFLDIEVQLDFWSNSISGPLESVTSVYQLEGTELLVSLRTFLSEGFHRLYQANSLALGLQFVYEGVRTTFVDTKGVLEKDRLETLRTVQNLMYSETAVVGRLEGIVACEITICETRKVKTKMTESKDTNDMAPHIGHSASIQNKGYESQPHKTKGNKTYADVVGTHLVIDYQK